MRLKLFGIRPGQAVSQRLDFSSSRHVTPLRNHLLVVAGYCSCSCQKQKGANKKGTGSCFHTGRDEVEPIRRLQIDSKEVVCCIASLRLMNEACSVENSL